MIIRGENYPQVARTQAVTALISLLSNGNTPTELKIIAAAALGVISHDLPQAIKTQAVTALIPLLSHRNLEVQGAAVRALGNIGQDSSQAVAALAPRQNSDSQFIRNSATAALSRILENSTNIAGLLAPLLNSENPHIKIFAANELIYREQNLPEVINALTSLLRPNNNTAVRISAAETLGRIGQNAPQAIRDQAVRAVGTLLSDNNPAIIRAGITALGNIGQDSSLAFGALSLFIGDYRGDDPNIRTAAFEAQNNILDNSQDAVRLLISSLRNSNTDIRVDAARYLGIRGRDSSEAITALIATLRDDSDDRVKAFAAESLGAIGNASQEVINALNPLLRHRQSFVRESAALALFALGQNSPELVRTLTSLLSDEHPFSRGRAAAVLGELGPNLPTALRNQAVSALSPLLRDSDTSVRASAAAALAKLGQNSPELIRTLTSLLSDESTFVRGEAAMGLSNIRQGIPHAVVPTLISLLRDRDNFVRISAVRALGNNTTQSLSQPIRDQAVTALIPLLSDANIPGRFVVETLGKLAPGSSQAVKNQAITGLIGALSNPDRNVQAAAANALVNIGQPAVPQLIGQFGNMSSLPLVSILSGIGGGAVDGLLEALRNENFVVRGNAAQALGNILGRGGVNVGEEKLNRIITELINMASNDRNGDARICAIQALSRIGPQARAAIPALQGIINNNRNREDLRREAQDALVQINGNR